MRKNIHERIYDKLEKLGVISLGQRVEAEKSVIDPDGGFMDLNFDYLGISHEPHSYNIALAHNYIQNGDVMADPDMEIRIYTNARYAEALSFQQDNVGLYQVVYPEPGKYYPKLKRELNTFLNQWLKNCIDQGHNFNKQDIAA